MRSIKVARSQADTDFNLSLCWQETHLGKKSSERLRSKDETDGLTYLRQAYAHAGVHLNKRSLHKQIPSGSFGCMHAVFESVP